MISEAGHQIMRVVVVHPKVVSNEILEHRVTSILRQSKKQGFQLIRIVPNKDESTDLWQDGLSYKIKLVNGEAKIIYLAPKPNNSMEESIIRQEIDTRLEPLGPLIRKIETNPQN
jgi:hypothetical protein